jgi:methylamine---glutamate N-methyltransferase subunit C
MNALRAPGFPEAAIRVRASRGTLAVFPPDDSYGNTLYGAGHERESHDPLDAIRIVPPVLMPKRLEMLLALGREPLHSDVDLDAVIGGFRSPFPAYVSAFGSTKAIAGDVGIAVSRQAAELGIPMVIGENVAPVNGYTSGDPSLRRRLDLYAGVVAEGIGGVAVQQSTEDADAEVWNLLYSDPAAAFLLDSGRLAFELKVGQGAKPGVGGMTLVDRANASRLDDRYVIERLPESDGERYLRCSSPGTVTEQILAHQVHQMKNNYPQCRIWVKLPPGRDIARAVAVAWEAGADAVTIDGAEGGTGWAPTVLMEQVGLPLGECLKRIGIHDGCLCASGAIWEGGRAAKCLALGARAVGLGRAALIAADENRDAGLKGLIMCLALELRLLISALGKYSLGELDRTDLWLAGMQGEHQFELSTAAPLVRSA